MMNVEKMMSAINFSETTVGEKMPKVFYLREEHKTKIPTKAELMARFAEKVEKAETFDFGEIVKEFKKENRSDLHLAKWGCRRNKLIDEHEEAIQAIKDFLVHKCPRNVSLIQSEVANSFIYGNIFDSKKKLHGIKRLNYITGALDAALQDLDREGRVKREVRYCRCYHGNRAGDNKTYKKCFTIVD